MLKQRNAKNTGRFHTGRFGVIMPPESKYFIVQLDLKIKINILADQALKRKIESVFTFTSTEGLRENNLGSQITQTVLRDLHATGNRKLRSLT